LIAARRKGGDAAAPRGGGKASAARGAGRGRRVKAVEENADTRTEILDVATAEFAEHGLSGSRVDEIAERTRTSKRMIYYHFKSKDGLYRAALERMHEGIRSLDSQVDVKTLSPREAIRRITEITFDHHADDPQFVRLVVVENIHQARSLMKLPKIRARNAAVIVLLRSVLERGHADGSIRRDVTALDLHMLISALCFFRMSNRYTFGYLFDCDLTSPSMRKAHREMACEVVDRYLAGGA
jgi:AcrR family transcriptional regulator